MHRAEEEASIGWLVPLDDRALPRVSAAVHLVVAAVLLLGALGTAFVTVASDRSGGELLLGSLLLALWWGALAWWCGRGAPWGLASGRAWGVGVLLGLVCGAAFTVGAWLFLELHWFEDDIRSLTGRAEATSLLATWAVAAVAGASEELFFRGTVYSWCRGRWPVVASTLLYTVAMLVNQTPALLLAALVLGAVCGWARWLTDSLLAPVLVHVLWTSAMLLVLPLLL